MTDKPTIIICHDIEDSYKTMVLEARPKTYFTHEKTHDFLDNLIFEFTNGHQYPCCVCGEMTSFYEDCGIPAAMCSEECESKWGPIE